MPICNKGKKFSSPTHPLRKLFYEPLPSASLILGRKPLGRQEIRAFFCRLSFFANKLFNLLINQVPSLLLLFIEPSTVFSLKNFHPLFIHLSFLLHLRGLITKDPSAIHQPPTRLEQRNFFLQKNRLQNIGLVGTWF